ncbi:ATP-dependent protease LonB [Candidatus Methanomassiliicoccus intestinalis]|jgi:putative ATP-dependent protease|uniref:Archaeal Lon protease n=2 Tax=Candidatus Methanomassiliicoccus intestinalis TaxID=1406512 RepID=R9T805_METII|nr:ATP-dependent protease LonB [Candidatus Methanomassiliicoccus intestinalis]AGN26840.1 ATP-dependent protease Lon [Candidatus Methanomassiliicoccus intestinalis Issoire-Mx1]TQS82958.1 MAG: ATP-dependent protease LonB [Candidatus Methanomassiliicoccus intestinalis]TQS83813.1 MAG: ATP-dependent protease LonB [Candidatus Methanomassiliicoccus intestinalis]
MSNEQFSSTGRSSDIDNWLNSQNFNTTADIEIPEKLADQVIGQDSAVEVIKKAAEQRRHVMLIGEPGTGKSMLARSMTEYLPKSEMQDIIGYHNQEDPNEPKIRVVPAGKGKEIVAAQKREAMQRKQQKTTMLTMIMVLVGMMCLAWFIITMDTTILFVALLFILVIMMAMRYIGGNKENYLVPKLLVGHDDNEMPPFVDATGAHAGALLGDVKHDPFQSGGLETPAHERLEVGAIHKASRGVLFIDEINLLRTESQQSLLTALQEGKFSITGQSERSSGAMVKSEPVPCEFILVCAGNLDAIQGMHPALRSRIRGYGYEVYMQSTMPDTDENRTKLVRFVAQEIAKDKKIPHFDKAAVGEILKEAQRRAGRFGHLTLRLRELGGLIRVSGDVARERGADLVTADIVVDAKRIARSLEQQIADRYLESKKEYNTFVVEGDAVGVVNGLAALNGESSMSEYSGVVLPIVAEVTPPQTRSGGRIIATGKLGEIAKEAVENVSALVKKYSGEDISNHDVHIQFIGTYEGVEGDSASVSVATAVISAYENIPIDQTIAMTGSLSVRGQVLPVGGVTAKIEAAADSGIKKVIIPRSNLGDVVIEDRYMDMIEIVPVDTLGDVLENALVSCPEKESLVHKFTNIVSKGTEKIRPVNIRSSGPTPN